MEDQEYTIDLMEVAGIISENRKPIAKITGGFIAAAILYLLIASPVYESEALLRIKQQQGLGSSLLDAATGGFADCVVEVLEQRVGCVHQWELCVGVHDEGCFMRVLISDAFGFFFLKTEEEFHVGSKVRNLTSARMEESHAGTDGGFSRLHGWRNLARLRLRIGG